MTFKKGLVLLREEFERTKAAMTDIHHVEKIVKIADNTRRTELVYLEAILEYLETHTPASSDEYYGALQTARIHTGDVKRSKLAKNLAATMNLKAQRVEDRPSLYDEAQSYSFLNALLPKLLFTSDKEGKLVLNEDNIFFQRDANKKLIVDSAKFKTLIKLSYQLEQQAKDKILDQLKTSTETTTIEHYKIPQKNHIAPEILQKISLHNINFETLRQYVTGKVFPTELSKNGVGAQDELSGIRAAQRSFIERTIQLLRDAKCQLDDNQKTGILAGAIMLVCFQIQKSYGITSPENSHLYLHLSALFKNLSSDESESLLAATNNFVRYFTIKNIFEPPQEQKQEQKIKRVVQKEKMENHPFADITKTKGFELETILKLFHELICFHRTRTFDITMAAYEKAHQPKEESQSIASAITSSFSGALTSWGLYSTKDKAQKEQTKSSSNNNSTNNDTALTTNNNTALSTKNDTALTTEDFEEEEEESTEQTITP